MSPYVSSCVNTALPASRYDIASGGGAGGQSSASVSGAGMVDAGVPEADWTPLSASIERTPRPLEEVQREYIDWRFGMFIHFGILTYTGSWSEANLDISEFNPTELDPRQWADVARAAGMKYGVLTTRHHDGFALWNSAVSEFDVGSIPWRDGKGDVVREFVDAFRSRGLHAGLYYSVWDNTRGVGNRGMTAADMAYVKAQLTELLTNYGPIPILVLDGYSWKMGHLAASYQEIRAHIKSLQPNCLILDHTHVEAPWDVDIMAFEEPKGVFAPAGNTIAATQGQKIVSGNDWFWAPTSATQNPMTVTDIVTNHLNLLEARYTNFLLNCPPNRKGKFDDNIATRLAEVGRAWKPNLERAPLPAQGPQNEYPYTPAAATATSGIAGSAIDGLNDRGYYSVWESSGKLPQSVTLDLGSVQPDVGYFGYVPRHIANQGASTEGVVTEWILSVSRDNATFTEVASGKWPVTKAMKVVTFAPTAARYVRFAAIAANGGAAAATELVVGARR
jgi:alpha-L-fucosidase